MMKTRVRKMICHFLAVIMSISGLGCDVLGAQSDFASFEREQYGSHIIVDGENETVLSCQSYVPEIKLHFEAMEQEDYFEEMERRERMGVRAAFHGTSYSILSDGLLQCQPSGHGNGDTVCQFDSQSGLESTIQFIQHSDGKK